MMIGWSDIMTTNKWYNFDKVNCISKLSSSAETLTDCLMYCGDDRIKHLIEVEIYVLTGIITEVIKSGVYKNEK